MGKQGGPPHLLWPAPSLPAEADTRRASFRYLKCMKDNDSNHATCKDATVEIHAPPKIIAPTLSHPAGRTLRAAQQNTPQIADAL